MTPTNRDFRIKIPLHKAEEEYNGFPFKKEDWPFLKILKWLGLVVIVIIVAQAINAIQRLSSFYHMIALKNLTFVVSFQDFFTTPILKILQRTYSNSHGLLDWTWRFLTPSIVLLVILSFFWENKKFLKEKICLFSWFLLPFLALVSFAIVLYPRFLLFMVMPLLVLAAFTLEQIRKKIKNKLLLVTCYLLLVNYYTSLQIKNLISHISNR